MKTNDRGFIILAVCGGMLTGCATKVPMVRYHEGTYQTKVQALQHWDLMAEEIADKTAGVPAFSGKSVALTGSTGTSDFLRALNAMVKTELLNKGVRVLETPDAALTLSVETQLVRHGERFVGNPTTLLGALGYAGVHVFTGQTVGTRRSAKAELLVLSVVREGGIAKMAVKQIVYVSDDEASLYETTTLLEPRSVSTLKVTQ
jgi:hypothetical protein